MRLLLRAVSIGLALVLGNPSLAQPTPSEAPMVFIWRVDRQSGTTEPAGSGFIIGPYGDILTAKHVWEHNPGQNIMVSIETKDANKVPILDDVECHESQDFCFLRILPAHVKIAETEFYSVTCRRPLEGEAIFAYGFLPGRNGISKPKGFTTTGTVDLGVVLTSVDLEPSMSGGPVFDASGAVIAVIKGGIADGLQTAVQPLQRASNFLEDRGIACPVNGDKPSTDAGSGPNNIVAQGNNKIRSSVEAIKMTSKDLQKLLFTLGYHPGLIDGIYGNSTREAVIRFQIENKLAETGLPDEETLQKLVELKENSRPTNHDMCNLLNYLSDNDQILVLPTYDQNEAAAILFNWLIVQNKNWKVSYDTIWIDRFKSELSLIGYNGSELAVRAVGASASLAGNWKAFDIVENMAWKNPRSRDFFLVVGADFASYAAGLVGSNCDK